MGAAFRTSTAPGAAWLLPPQSIPRRWLVFALLGLLLLARQPEDLLRPQFNAEEGSIFFQQAYNDGFWSTLFAPASGYFHLTLRLTAGLALLVPLELAPLVFKLVAFAIQMLPVAYLLAADVPGFVATPLFRVLAAAVYVAGPNSMEPYLNVLNSQWHLTLAACLILLAGPRPGRLRRTVDAGVLLLFATSGPFSLVCAPLALWSWWRNRRRGSDRRWSTGPVIALAGAALQLILLLTGSRAAGAATGFSVPSAAEIVRIVGLNGVCNGLLGLKFTVQNHQAFPPGAAFVAAAILPALALVAVRLRNLALLVLFVLAAASVAVVFLFPLNDPRLWLDPNFAPRYFFFTMLFVVFSALALAERGGRWRWVALPALASALLIGVYGDYRIPAAPDTHWRDQIAAFRSLPPGTTFFIPVYPQPTEWGLTLLRRPPPDGTDALSRYRPADGPAVAVMELIGTTLPPESASPDQKFVFAGYAVDAASRRPAGGVLIQVDDRLFPAVTGLDPEAARSDPSLAGAGFMRLVPRTALGPGTHRLRVLALDHTGTALLTPGPSSEFTIP